MDEISILPTDSAELQPARCFMFYEWEKVLDSTWLDTVDEIFSEFGSRPFRGIGNLGKRKTKGRFNRIREKLESFMIDSNVEAQPDIRIDSEPTYPEESFFPCDVRITWSVAISGMRIGMVAVREPLVENCNRFVDRVAQKVYQHIGKGYATCFDFPAVYGPDYYLSAVGAVPSGIDTRSNRRYQQRLTRWRDNTWHGGRRVSDGYIREVYPINFLFDSHLTRNISGRPLSEYLEKYGSIGPSGFMRRIYRWDLSSTKLQDARRFFEASGIVLSSSSSV